MPTLSPGAICTVRQFGSVLFVAKEPVADHLGAYSRYRLTCMQVDSRGRRAFQSRDAGLGDITVVHDAEVYQVGSIITYEGLDHIVLRDLGDDGVEVGVPEDTAKPPRGYGVIHIPAGNTRVLHKADLILAGLN